MFESDELKDHLKTSHTIESGHAVYAEWNLNEPDNIEKLGNYRYRPFSNEIFAQLINFYDPLDISGYYTGATDSDTVVDNGFTDDNIPETFVQIKEKMNMLYSLEDCIKPFRPRSGINKLLYLGVLGAEHGYNQYFDDLTKYVARRPRYYMSSKFDQFKYWTSYRNEKYIPNNDTGMVQIQMLRDKEFGISKKEYSVTDKFGTSREINYIEDAVPFVVYKDEIPTNKLIIKMQTNVGEQDLGPFRMGNSSNISDPLYGDKNKTVPKQWRIQVLKSNDWVDIISFNDTSLRSNGTDIIKSDGYVEIGYGLKIPEQFKNNFFFAQELSSDSELPDTAPLGYSYLITDGTELGMMFTYTGSMSLVDHPGYDKFVPQYGWEVSEEETTTNTKVITKLTNPDYFMDNSKTTFREFELIRGIRIVVETMNKKNTTFDLIEFSPRLFCDITNNVTSFSITKTLSDLGNSSIPVGSLFASSGNIEIFDDEYIFNSQNPLSFNGTEYAGSVISKHLDTVAKFIFYDITKNVSGFDYYVPIKTLYSQGFPQVSGDTASVSITLRDFYFYLESMKAPQMLLTDVSMSYAITVLLDSIGFSNYTFKRVSNEELLIPYFFVTPDQNVAEVLQQLAISSQSAMFFDEYNNLVIMAKDYILPSESERSTDLILYGDSSGEASALPNILSIASQDKKVYNGGQINYTTRYIQRSLGSIKQAPYSDEYKTYTYKPVLLWEVEANDKTQTQNELVSKSSGYSLAAVPLSTDLTSSPPEVKNNVVVNNVLDLGENAWWLTNFSGYLYANGEIIKYDAIEYSVQGVGIVWVSNNHQYQDYFSRLQFNGKIYATGNIRIYSEPEYETVNGVTRLKTGKVKAHGRAQFGTPITNHYAGLTNDTYWTNVDNVRGCVQEAKKYLFTTGSVIEYPSDLQTEFNTVREIDEVLAQMKSIETTPNSPNLENFPTILDDMSKNTIAGKVRNISGTTDISVSFEADEYAKKSTRNGIIKNFLANTGITEEEVNKLKSVDKGAMQSSALIFNGPTFQNEVDPANFVSYVYKELNGAYKHFGTRMRIVGKIESNSNKSQTPNGGFNLFSSTTVNPTDPSKDVSITGGSGGIAINLNKKTNNGYYFEIVALSSNMLSSYTSNDSSLFYGIAKSPILRSVNDLVTAYTETQHTYSVGEKVLMSGLIDDSRKTNINCTLNGEYEIISIGSNRKSFQYQITPPRILSANIISALGNGVEVTFSCENTFRAGQIVTISGCAGYNGTFVVNKVKRNDTGAINLLSIAGDANNEFTVLGGGTATSSGGTAVYQKLNTTSSTGGQVKKKINTDLSISNIYFYKILAGSNISTIIGKKRTGNKVVLTTLKPHSFAVNDEITVENVDAALNGTFVISSISERTVSYTTTSTGTIDNQNMDPVGSIKSVARVAIPKILWQGLSSIIVDDGKFTGQTRFSTTEKPTVYDLAVEYITVGKQRQFFLYINGKQVATVLDPDPIPEYKNMALFVRGSSRCMFENVYALTNNQSQNSAASLQLPVSKVFGDEEINSSESLNSYAMSGFIQKTYLSGISSAEPPKYNLYFDEFGTIMREVAHFNIRYDRAYPALYAKIAPTINGVKGYSVSGFQAGSYGADFLIFNCIDKNLNLDDTTGNYLRILGIAFTQNTTYSLTVDDYFNKIANLSNPILDKGSDTYSTIINKKIFDQIKNSRVKYGENQFTIDSPYIQTTDAAEEMMGWIMGKMIYPRKTIGVNTFATSNVQLGDIVQIQYTNNDGINVIDDPSKRYVVYNIEYQKQSPDLTMTMHLAEV